jgi:hypothetical protein
MARRQDGLTRHLSGADARAGPPGRQPEFPPKSAGAPGACPRGLGRSGHGMSASLGSANFSMISDSPRNIGAWLTWRSIDVADMV